MTQTAPSTAYDLRIDVASCSSCGEATVYLAGALDARTAPDLVDRLRLLADKRTIVVDLTGLSSIDTAGVQVLLAAAGTSTGQPQVTTRNPQPRVEAALARGLPDHALASMNMVLRRS